jgi:hypothetical protein
MSPEFIWDLEDDPAGNVRHVAENGLSIDDVIHAFETVYDVDVSRSSGRRLLHGFAVDDFTEITVIYEQVADDLVYVVTAFERGV